MTVSELMSILEEMPRDAEVVVYDSNGMEYGYAISDVLDEKAISAFYGNDYKVVAIDANRQVGMVRDEEYGEFDDEED